MGSSDEQNLSEVGSSDEQNLAEVGSSDKQNLAEVGSSDEQNLAEVGSSDEQNRYLSPNYAGFSHKVSLCQFESTYLHCQVRNF